MAAPLFSAFPFRIAISPKNSPFFKIASCMSPYFYSKTTSALPSIMKYISVAISPPLNTYSPYGINLVCNFLIIYKITPDSSSLSSLTSFSLSFLATLNINMKK